jgi:anti-anti-sigma regulatory factor
MLRLTRLATGPAGTVLRAEGQIVGEWVELLEAECRRLMETQGRVLLDLSRVTYLDSGAVRTLRMLTQGPLALVNCPPLVEELLTEDVT